MVSRYVPNFTLGIGHVNSNGHPPSHIAPMPLGVAMAATAPAAVPLSSVTQSQSQQQSSQPQSQGGGVGQPPQPQQMPSQGHSSQGLKGPPSTSNPQTSVEYHVQQCLMPAGPGGTSPQAPHQHYRIIHSRSDGYVAAPSAGFSAPQSGPPHQGPSVIRGMQSAPPPTPPQQQELSKMQQPPQPMFVPTGGGTATGAVRPNQQTNLYRSPSTAAPRPSRHVTMSQQMYSPQMPMVMSPFYTPHPHPAASRQPASQIYSGAQYFQQPQLPTYSHYPYFLPNSYVPQHRPSAVPGGIVTTPAGATLAAGPGGSQAQILPPVLTTTGTAGQTGAGQTTGTSNNGQRKRRRYALDIINPVTNANVLDDLESKNQNTCSTSISDVDYQESMSLPPGNDILGGGATSVSQVMDPNISSDPNYNTKTLQGMAFVDMMQHHKINAIPPPCQTQVVSQVNEMIGPTTPIVSAMSGPSVEIHPKPLTKKKGSRAIDPMPPPSTQSSTDKSTLDSGKVSIIDCGHASMGEGNLEKNLSQTAAATIDVPLVNKTCEDNSIPVNKAIKNRSDSENSTATTTSSTVHSSNLGSTNIDSRDSVSVSTNKSFGLTSSSSTSTVSSNSNHQQQQQQNTSTQHSSQSSQQQQQQQSSSQHQLQSQQQQQQALKRETKASFQKSATQQQQHLQQSTLPASATSSNSTTVNSFIVNNNSSSNNNQSGNKTFSSTPSYSNISSQTVPTSTMPSVANAQSTATCKQQQQQQHHHQHQQISIVSIDGSNSAASTSNIGKMHKGKDKNLQHHQQQQQVTSISNSCGVDVPTSPPLIANSPLTQDKQNSANNNTAERTKSNEKGDNKQKMTSDCKDSPTTTHSNHNKKLVNDKNENIIGDRYEEASNLESKNDINQEENEILSQSLDETDRIGITNTTSELVDEINNYCNNNDKSYSVTENANNTTNNNVMKSTSKSLPQNDNDNISSDRIQQKPVASKENTKSNSGSNNNVRNEIKSGEVEASKQLTSESESNEKLTSDSGSSVRRDSNESTTELLSITITNGTSISNTGPASPPLNNTIAISNEMKKSGPELVPSLIHYNEGQWSPANPDGAKVYNRNQLLDLRNSPASKTKPNLSSELANIVLQSEGDRISQSSLMPTFVTRLGKRGQSIGGPANMSLGSGSITGSVSGNAYLKQASMSGVNAKNSSKGSKSGIIHLSLSLREDVKLNETENAWRPTHLKQNDNVPAEERAKEELFRKVRGILNKLTPEKFETLVDQIMKLQIDTKEKVNGVMILVFEKAIDEPNFSASYAKLCQRLADNKLQSEIKAGKEGGKAAEQQKASNLAAFKNALLDKTEREFKENVSDCQAKERKLQPLIEKIAKCTDAEKKLELKATLEEEERKIRRRSGGTVRFIGELFKISMLTGKIIKNCIDGLLDPSSEDKLECLCKLLTTVGKKLESPAANSKENAGRVYSLEDVIAKMKNIVDRKVESKISSRVRFMLQDVIDLRKNKWVSTKTDVNPKTMDQIQKEVKTEQMTSQYSNFSMISNKKDDKRYSGTAGGSGNSSGSSLTFSNSGGGSSGGSGGYYKSNRQQQSSDEPWLTQTSKGNRAVDTSKFGMFNTDIDTGTKLGGMSRYQWQTTSTSNSFAALSNLDSNKNSNSGPRNKGSFNKGSMERDRYDIHGRTGSSHGSRESSSSRSASTRGSDRDKDRDNGRGNIQRGGGAPSHHSYGSSSSTVPSRSNRSPASMSQISLPSSTSIENPRPPPSIVFEKPDEDDSAAINSSIDKMICIADEESFEATIPIISKFSDKYHWCFIYSILCDYLHIKKVKEAHRKIASDLILFLINKNFITIEHFRYAYLEFSEFAHEINIDVPGLWQYIFQFVGPLVYKKVLTIKDIWNDTLYKNERGKGFLKEMILYFTREVGPKYMRELWKKSNLKWTDFIPADDVKKFIEDNKFEFIESEDKKPPVAEVKIQKVKERVRELLNESASNDDIYDYLEANIINIDKIFIRSLTETLCEYAIISTTNKLDENKFQQVCIPILQRYLDSREDREFECLIAIQLLIHRLEHPSGLLNDIFGEIYDADIIPPDSFIRWRDSNEELTGKGVAVKGLYSFFNHMLSGETSEENN